jgi:aryl-alcohol dehydrogenase-like predicted oxidoreductase
VSAGHAPLTEGWATPEGTAAYATRVAPPAVPEHYRMLDGCRASSLGTGTYLGGDDDVADAGYRAALTRALELGLNVIDTAINYRCQRSERVIGRVLADGIASGRIRRDEVVVSTKGGFIPFDGSAPRDPARYVVETYVKPGIVDPKEIVAGCHCLAPRYLADQIDRSRANLGLATLDVYFLHNPEMQLEAVSHDELVARVRGAFEALEGAVAAGKIRRYGTATWSGYRRPIGAPDRLGLAELVGAARDVAGGRHHFRVLQLPYNLAMTEAFTLANQVVGGATGSLLAAAEAYGLYVMASAPLYQGQLTRRLPEVVEQFLPGLATSAQRAIQFVRSTPGIGTALVGMKSVAHVDDNAQVRAIPAVPWRQFQRLFTAA